MAVALRASGLGPVEDLPWSSHLCSFYETPQDLLDLLVPYFTAGLEANERCIWITSTPLTVEDAKAAMREAVSGFDELLAERRMIILPHDQWYLEDGVFDMERVLKLWAQAVDTAVNEGYDGLRVSGNTAWLEPCDWEAFAEYERTIDSAVAEAPILVL